MQTKLYSAMNNYCFVVSFTFRAVVATNDGLLSLPRDQAAALAVQLEANYPGAEFYAVSKKEFTAAEACAAEVGAPPATRVLFLDGSLLDWSVKSYTDWLEVQIDPVIVKWLRSITRRD